MNFRENFKPTKEERIKRYEALLNIHKKLIGNCCTCKHYKGIRTRGIVTSYGKCKLNNMLFIPKNCIDEKLNCDSYEENINIVEEIKKHIKELKGE